MLKCLSCRMKYKLLICMVSLRILPNIYREYVKQNSNQNY